MGGGILFYGTNDTGGTTFPPSSCFSLAQPNQHPHKHIQQIDISSGDASPLSRFTIGAMADIWGPVNYDEADPFSCVASGASIAQIQSADAPIRETLYPINGAEILIAMAQAGETIYEYQLVHLSPEEKQAVLDALESLGMTLDTTWPGERRN